MVYVPGGAVLKRQHRRARARWYNTVKIPVLDLANWRRVWFSDESRLIFQRRDDRVRVYRRCNERFAPNCVVEVDNYGGGSVMVWGAISYARKTQLVSIQGNLNGARYRDDILQPHLLPAIDLRGDIFQQDNARPHTERLTINYLQNQNITLIPLPSKSPDLKSNRTHTR